MKKLTTQEFILRAKATHNDTYDYSLTQYVNAHTKVTVICRKHGQFQAVVNAKGHYGCNKCVGKFLSTEEFIFECQEKHGNKYDYSQTVYTGIKNDIQIICPQHGIFTQKPTNHKDGYGCQKCAGLNKTVEEIIVEARKVHGDKYDYSKVTHTATQKNIEIICPSHGSFFQSIPNHINNKQGCKACGLARTLAVTTKSQDQFIEDAITTHGDRYDYSKVNYINANTKVEIICRVHGSFVQTPPSHVGGRGCRKCNISKSKVEKEWLDYLGIVDRQVAIQLPNNKFIVDGYDARTKTVYEFYGDYWHGNLNTMAADRVNVFTKESMITLNKKTCERENLLRSHGYTVVSIWEDDWRRLKRSL